jgi:hypothetical protein
MAWGGGTGEGKEKIKPWQHLCRGFEDGKERMNRDPGI